MKTKLDADHWAKIIADPKEAKKALVGLEIEGKGAVKFVTLANGNQIPVSEITEKQAHEFMLALCPSWAKQ